MAVQDIYSPVPGDATIRNGSIVVNPGGPFVSTKYGNGGIYRDTSYNDENIPVIASISGKYTDRWDDVLYTSITGGTY